MKSYYKHPACLKNYVIRISLHKPVDVLSGIESTRTHNKLWMLMKKYHSECHCYKTKLVSSHQGLVTADDICSMTDTGWHRWPNIITGVQENIVGAVDTKLHQRQAAVIPVPGQTVDLHRLAKHESYLTPAGWLMNKTINDKNKQWCHFVNKV